MGCGMSKVSTRIATDPAAGAPVDGARVSNREETPVHSDTTTSQQQQTRREQELSVELEQARQQIKILQQVLSRCYLHDIIEYISLF